MNNGVVIVTAENSGSGTPIGIQAGSQQNSLFRGKNGMLILRQTKTTMFLPFYLGTEGHWYRFKPIQEEDFK
jgi:hypothetical protein